jgi:hypothetical protein
MGIGAVGMATLRGPLVGCVVGVTLEDVLCLVGCAVGATVGCRCGRYVLEEIAHTLDYQRMV